jgi:hypothetical protein
VPRTLPSQFGALPSPARIEVEEMIEITVTDKIEYSETGLPILKAFHQVLFERWVSRRAIAEPTNCLV